VEFVDAKDANSKTFLFVPGDNILGVEFVECFMTVEALSFLIPGDM
jgi:hypothetical protein